MWEKRMALPLDCKDLDFSVTLKLRWKPQSLLILALPWWGRGKPPNKMTLSSGPQGRFVVFLPIAVLLVSSPVEEEIMFVTSKRHV